MRSSAPEGQHAPRAKQAPPSGSSGAAAGPTGVQPTSPHSNSISSRPQTTISHKTASPLALSHKAASPLALSQRSSGVANPPSNRVSSHSRSLAGHQSQQQQRSSSKVGGSVPAPQSQQHQRSPPTTPTQSTHSPLQQPLPSGGKPQPQLQTPPNKLLQSRISQTHLNSPQSTGKPNSVGSQPRLSDSSSKQAAPKLTPQQQPPTNPPNFGEYDDQEWDVGVGHLIIDLDADIAQADRGRMSGAPPSTMVSSHQGTPGSAVSEDKHSLKMKIKRTKPPTKTSEAKHEIVKPDVVQIASPGIAVAGTNGNTPNSLTQHNGTNVKIENNGTPRTPVTPRPVFKKEKRRLDVNGSPSPPPPSCTSQRIAAHPTLTSSGGSSTLTSYSTPLPTTTSHYVSAAPNTTSSNTVTSTPTVVTPALTHPTSSPHSVNILGHQIPPVQIKTEPRTQGPVPVSSNTGAPKTVAMQPQHCPSLQQQTAAQAVQQSMQVNSDRLSPNKRQKLNDDDCVKKDVCVGTSVGTITEPDCLGPCEPGTSVTLEGIVWHETEGGVLVVNVTWRGKTYVGTLLDCTKHDWAPPRYCDSPTSDLESRTPKGRAKRGRTAASSANAATTTHTPATELSVTETRSGKLRNATIKGRRGGGTPTFNPPPSPVKSEVGGTKRKGREAESCQQTDPKNFKKARSSSRGTPTNGCSSPSLEQQLGTPQPTPNCNSEHSNPPSSPQLIECPEPNCNKKYKHINGLKYHQSHAHTNSVLSIEDEASTTERSENSEVEDTRHPSPTPVASTPIDASSQDLIKPAVLRPTVPSLPPQSGKGDVGLPISPLQVLGTNTQLPSAPQQVYVYSKNGGNASPQKPSATVPSLTSSNKVLIGNDCSLPNQLTGSTQNFEVNTVSQTFEVNTISQQQTVEEQQPLSQSQNINKQNPTNNTSTKSSHIVQSPMQGIQQQPVLPVHISQPPISSQIHAQSLPVTQPQTVLSNNTNAIQNTQSHISTQLQHPSQLISSQPNQPVQTLQNITTSTPIHTTQTHPTLQANAGGPPSSTNPNSLMPSSQQQNVQSLTHLSSQPYFSPQNHSFSAYSPQIMESCPPSLVSQHSSPQTGRIDVLGGLMPVNSSISRSASEGASPVQNVASVIPMNVSNIPQGTPLSSLPGSSPMLVKDKSLEGDKLSGKPKELVNGLSPKKEEEISREDARSPAYSDISDANDSTSVIDGENDSKDFKDEKKPELPLGANSHYAYNLYFGAYGQPHHPYMMPSLQPPPGLPMKPGDIKDLKDKLDKDKKDGAPHLPGGNDYMKFPPQYMYSYSHIYPPGYPDPYMREPMYKELIDKAKFEQKESQLSDENDKGPTDLSRSNIDKNSHNHRDIQSSVNSPKEYIDSRGHTPEKRPIDPVHAYRYINSYDNRIEKSNESKISLSTSKSVTPIPLSSPRLGSTPPINNKDDKNEKRNEAKSEGVKPTMETTGPPPPPTSSAYYPYPYSHVAFDPYRSSSLVPALPAGFPQSYLHGPHSQNLGLRYPMGIPNGPEDLSRSGSGGPILSPSGLYAGSHKIAELQERAVKLQSGQPVSSASSGLTRGNSPLTMYSKELHCNNMVQLPPHSMSPISQSSSSFTSSIASQHGSMMASNMGHPGDRKTPPVGARMNHSLPESYPYPLLSAQFPPHFAALGVTQPSMPTVGGPGLPPSGLGGAVHPPK